MTDQEFRTYMLFAAALAAALGVVNFMRPHKRWLGVGAFCLAAAALLYVMHVPVPVVALVCGIAVVCMVRDVAGRAGGKV